MFYTMVVIFGIIIVYIFIVKTIEERLRTETSVCGCVEENASLEELKTITTSISNLHIIVEILKWEGDDVNYTSSTESTPMIDIKLNEIPQIIVCANKTFELRGVGCYRTGLSRLRNSIGHYYAVCKRGRNNWELYDDMKKHAVVIKSTSLVPCEYLIYTI